MEMDRERKAFMTVPRMRLTKRFRELSGRDRTRIKHELGNHIDVALKVQGLEAHPTVARTSTDDYVRIVRLGTRFHQIHDAVLNPSPAGDDLLAAFLSSAKRGGENAHLHGLEVAR